MTEKTSNHLANQNSPYLLQHSKNPVDWYPWGDQAWSLANEKKCLVVISIGYSACHWCHVMEHESFEDLEVAEVMNQNYISIKVDREERPDVDHVYMAAAIAATGRGGWPLNVIALPDQRPVFAGTYFSKRDWIYVLQYYNRMFRNHPAEMVKQADELTAGIRQQFIVPRQTRMDLLNATLPAGLISKLQDSFDLDNGGTIGAPKFPMPVYLEFLLDHGLLSSNQGLVDFVSLSLDRMFMGGIYDHLGGGFSRYAVDQYWHVPHFEKMLYDNAQLISLYAKTYCHNKHNSWKQVIVDTIRFIDRELTNPEGLCFASIDADSENHEGAFYAWTVEEITRLLGPDADQFIRYYSCQTGGNWENGLNVLRLRNLPGHEQISTLENSRRILWLAREKRPRPATDSKILSSWNALMITAFIDAYKALSNKEILDKAIGLARLYVNHIHENDGKLLRDIRPGNQVIPGYLDDYGFLIKAFIDLYQVTLAETWLSVAREMVKQVFILFKRDDSPLFNLTEAKEARLIVQAAELTDNVIPASNSVMAQNLFVLGHILNEQAYIDHAVSMLGVMVSIIRANPAFHAKWARFALQAMEGPVEIKITGENPDALLRDFLSHYIPGSIFSGKLEGLNIQGPDVNDNAGNGKIYVCRSKTCFPPVDTPAEALDLIRNVT